MASADIKMQIVTALDAAGIKASQKEVDALAGKLKTVSRDDSTNVLEKKLTKLPGKIGEAVGAMGKFGKALGVAGAAMAAWKKGWELGSWINEKFVAPLLWAGEKSEEVAEKKLAASWDKAWKAMEKSNEAAIKGLAQTGKMEDAEIQRVKTLTQQYLKATSAKNRMASATSDADMQRLDIEQFEDEMSLIDQGREDAIPELQAYYALLKQQMQAKKELAAFDAKTEEERAKAQADYASKVAELDTKVAQKQALVDELDRQRDEAEAAAFDGRMTNAKKKAWLATDAKLAERQKAAMDELAIIQKQRSDFLAGDGFDVGQYDAIRATERATLAGKLSLDQRRLGLSYNSIVAGQGENLLGFGLGESVQSQLTQAAGKSYRDLDEIARNTAELADKLTELLAVK